MKIGDYKKIAGFKSEAVAFDHLNKVLKLRLIIRVRLEKSDDGIANNNVICMKDFNSSDSLEDCLINISTFVISKFGNFEYAVYYIDENGFCVVVNDFEEYHEVIKLRG